MHSVWLYTMKITLAIYAVETLIYWGLRLIQNIYTLLLCSNHFLWYNLYPSPAQCQSASWGLCYCQSSEHLILILAVSAVANCFTNHKIYTCSNPIPKFQIANNSTNHISWDFFSSLGYYDQYCFKYFIYTEIHVPAFLRYMFGNDNAGLDNVHISTF